MSALVLREWVYAGTPIHARDESVNLTEMWRATGSNPKKRPAEWLRRDSTIEFSAHLESVGLGHSLVSSENGNPRKGIAPTTWAHKHLALAYARYLDHAFHVWTNEVIFRELQAPTIAAPVAEPNTRARISDSPSEIARVRLAAARVVRSLGCSIQKVYGLIRRRRHVSSPFHALSSELPTIEADLELLETEGRGLLTARDMKRLEASKKQLTLWGSN